MKRKMALAGSVAKCSSAEAQKAVTIIAPILKLTEGAVSNINYIMLLLPERNSSNRGGISN